MFGKMKIGNLKDFFLRKYGNNGFQLVSEENPRKRGRIQSDEDESMSDDDINLRAQNKSTRKMNALQLQRLSNEQKSNDVGSVL